MKPLSILILFFGFGAILLVASSADEFNITKDLNDIIVGALKYYEKRNTTNLLKKLLRVNSDASDIYEIEPYLISDVVTYGINSNGTSIYYGFRDNKIQIHSHWFLMRFWARVSENGTQLDKILISFKISISSCLITAMYRSEKNSSRSQPSKIYYEYGDVESDYMKFGGKKTKHVYLDSESISLALLEQLVKQNEVQSRVLSKGFDDIRPRERILSSHPTFSNQEENYYYAIPNTSIGSIDLINISARGLHNIYSANYIDLPKKSSLLIGNIRGSMIACMISDQGCVSTFELDFQINLLYLSIYWDTDKIEVEAQGCLITETKSGRHFSKQHSFVIMDRIEKAIALAIMPSTTSVKRSSYSIAMINEVEDFFHQLLLPTSLEIDDQSAPKSTRKQHSTTTSSTSTPTTIHNDSIFTLNQSAPKSTQNSNITTTTTHHGLTLTLNQSTSKSTPNQLTPTITNNDRTIVLNNYLTINLPSGRNDQYLQHIQCPLLNSSMFTHRISLNSLGKKVTNNSGPDNLDIHFHFNFPSLNISGVEPTTTNSSSRSNDSCEFQIRNDRDIQVDLRTTPTNNTIHKYSNQQLEIIKKINSTMLSMMKERIVRTIRPIVCTSFDVCAQSVKMVDDYFQRFVSDILKKCSFGTAKNNSSKT